MAHRPPFILVFAADQQGCGYHRCMTPLASLVAAGVANGRVDMHAWDDDVALACNPDTVIWQRQVEDSQIAAMRRWRKLLPNAVFVYELDDYLNEIPPASFHASFMPPDIRRRVVEALALCDRVTTSTQPMAEWLRSLLPEGAKTSVLVVPNALPGARLQERPARAPGRLRVGFCGGMSHSGDLEIIKPAIAAIGDAVDWVFFGTQPDDCPASVEYHQGVPPHLYLDKLASLNMDLMLAPLQANRFNDCKSNLRILEAVVAGACVVAQNAVPYRENRPPVQYADTPDDWTRAIRTFMAASPDARQRDADLLRAWARRQYSLEQVLPARMQAWLPAPSGAHWAPQAVAAVEKFTVSCRDTVLTAQLRETLKAGGRARFCSTGLERACRDAIALNTNVLWLRPETCLGRRCLDVLQATLARHPRSAAIVPLASDGWNAFPQLDHWTPLPASVVEPLERIVGAEFEDVTLPVQTPVGPVSYISLRALKMLGIPDVAGNDGNEEQAILEWGLAATAREWPVLQAVDAFAGSMAAPVQVAPASVTRLQARGYAELLQAKPDRILTAASRQKIEVELLKQQWGGPRPGSMGFDNSYESWSLLRRTRDAQLLDAAYFPARVCVAYPFDSAEDGLKEDDWAVFTDATVELECTALRAFDVAVAEANPDVRVIYADHETLSGTSRMPEFKPDFDQTLLLAQDYITPICAVKVSALADIPRTRLELFESLLKILRDRGGKAFGHVQKILGTLTVDPSPEKLALETVQRQAVLERLFGPDLTTAAHPHVLGCLNALWSTTQTPSVCIVIPTLGQSRLLEPCIKTILQHTAYPHYEILIVQNGERRQPDLSPSLLELPNIRVLYWDKPFNWAAINNWAIAQTNTDYIVTMNDDVCVAAKNWLSAMLGQAAQPGVGAVGAKLVHPGGYLQHVGVICHRGIAGHLHKGQPNGVPGYMGRALLSHEAIAVTGACMLFSKAAFDLAGGFNEHFAMNYNDTVFCLELHRRGLRNIVEMSAELLHAEASSRPPSNTTEGAAILAVDNMRLARHYPRPDPYWNVNLQIQSSQNGLMLQGLNADMLAWDDFMPHDGARRVLLINDLPGPAGCALDLLRRGEVPFAADLSGFKLRLTAPAPTNVPPWDVRDARSLNRGLQALGIGRVVLRSLVGTEGAAPPVETLRALGTLRPHIAVTLDPVDFATMAPWLDADEPADDTGADAFGYADRTMWKAAYDQLAAL